MKKNNDIIRFLATGDFHSDLKLVKKIQKEVDFSSIDFVLFTGDLSEKNNDFKDLFSIFNSKKILMVPGNHESKLQLDILKEKYKVHLVGNAPVKINDELVIFGTNYLSIGPHGIYEEDVFKNLKINFDTIKDIKVKLMLSHIPPSNTSIGDGSPFDFIGGSDAVSFFLENHHPDILLCGHIHETSGLEEIINKTKVVNVGRTFKIIEFNNKTKKLNVINL